MPTSGYDLVVKLLRGESDRVVVVEGDGATVRKTFHAADAELANQAARREFDRIQRFSVALAGVEGAACPEGKELIPGVAPCIRMSRAEGAAMSWHLGHRLDSALLQRLADVIAETVLVYVATFDEPYFDLHFCNMFYDEANRVVTFIDFGLPYPGESMPEALRGITALEVTLGNLIGSSVFESARPRVIHQRQRHRQGLLLANLVAKHPAVLASGMVSPPGLLAGARVAFERPAYRGGLYRQLWYRTAGSVLARPARTLLRTCSLHEDRPLVRSGGGLSSRRT